MGKCLSCCLGDDSSTHDNSTKGLDSSSKTDTTESSSAPADPRTSKSLATDITGSVPASTGEHIINSSLKNSISEKLMFYQRIPPIRSGSSESKRSSQSLKEFSESKAAALFERYKEPHEDTILSEGIIQLCQDLEVKPDDFKVLLLAWKFRAEQMCRFTRSEFIEGCRTLRVDSIQGIQSRFPDMIQEVQDPEKFKDLYRFTFKFGLEVGQRILPTEMAIQLWKLVFFQRCLPILPRWLLFLEKHPTIRGIPRDTWNMFLNFTETVGNDLSTYDDSEAWPSLFDDFVEFENDQTNQNIYQGKPDMT